MTWVPRKNWTFTKSLCLFLVDKTDLPSKLSQPVEIPTHLGHGPLPQKASRNNVRTLQATQEHKPTVKGKSVEHGLHNQKCEHLVKNRTNEILETAFESSTS